MGFTDNKLKYTIEGDNASLKAAVIDSERQFGKLNTSAASLQHGFKEAASEASNLVGVFTGDRLTGATSQITSLAGAAGAIPGAMGLAVGAIAGIGTAAVGTGDALFALVHRSAEFGKELFDATQKTGLSAAAISTLKLNADNAGSSLESVTTGISKFAKLLGQAADGSTKAQETLKQYGITTTELNPALEQAFRSVNGLANGTEQLAAAQKLFGKTGADLIPTIKQMGGGFDESIEKAEKLGLTLRDSDLRAADEFTVALGTLGAQAKIIAAVFGLQVAPVITDAMKDVSKVISENHEEIRGWAIDVANAFKGAAIAVRLFAGLVPGAMADANTAVKIATLGVLDLSKAWNVATFGLHGYLVQLIEFDRRAGGAKAGAGLGTVGGGSGTGGRTSGGLQVPEIGDLTGGRAPRGGGRDAQSDADRLERERIAKIHAATQQEIAEKAAANDTILARYQSDLKEGIISEEQALQYRQQITRDFFVFKLDELDKELQQVEGNADAETKIRNERKVLEMQYETELEKQRGETAETYEKQLNRQIELWKEQGKQIAEANKKAHTLVETLANPTLSQGPQYTGPNVLKKDFQFDALGELRKNFEGDGNAAMIAGIDAVTTAFSSLGQAVGDAVQAFVLYGNAGTSVRKVTAQILAAIAQQAAVQAVYELAQGFAMLALSFFGFTAPAAAPSAAYHFASAAIYAGIAGVAAGVGRGVAGNSFNKNKGGSTGAAGSPGPTGAYGTGADKINQHPTPYSRVSDDAYISGDRNIRTLADQIGHLHEAVRGLNQKIGSMPAHEVLSRAAQQRPGIIGRQVVKDIRTHADIGTDMRKASGQRR